MADFNSQIINQYRENNGELGENFPFPVLLLHTVGKRSGEARIHPVAYLPEDGHYYVFGSAGGADNNPAWYYNLVAAPTAQVELPDETFDVNVAEVQGEERDRVYEIQAGKYPQFREYTQKTSRVIPVVSLTRV